MVHVFAYSPTKWNFAHNQLKFFMDLKNAMKNTWICLEHFHGSLKTAFTMPWKSHELQHEDILGFSTSLKTLASTFNQYLKVCVSMVGGNGVNCLDIKTQPYPQYLKIINLPLSGFILPTHIKQHTQPINLNLPYFLVQLVTESSWD